MRVCGECCGLRRRGFGEVKEKVLSLGADSLWQPAPWIWVEVREWFFINSLKSMGYLQTDRASFKLALGSKRDCTATLLDYFSKRFKIFPVGPFGSSVTNSNRLGTL